MPIKRKTISTRVTLREACRRARVSTFGCEDRLIERLQDRNDSYFNYMNIDEQLYDEWSRMCRDTFDSIKCCPICAFVCYGNKPSFIGLKKPNDTILQILQKNYDLWLQYTIHRKWIYCSRQGRQQARTICLQQYIQSPSAFGSLQVCPKCYVQRNDEDIMKQRSKLPFCEGTVECNGEKVCNHIMKYAYASVSLCMCVS